jgi:L-alanine-DL-glutamate epimerase-like enolase superfamily enzyme
VRALKTISVRVPKYFPVEVAQRYLDEISREIPAKLLLLGAKFDVALADLEGRAAPQKAYQLLGRRDLPTEIRSKAARSMLGYRGAIALREKMKPLGYPNLAKAREAQRLKAAEGRLSR